MTDVGVPAAPAPLPPPIAPGVALAEDAARIAKKQGCLRWGLVGCAGASVAVIIGLLFLMNNAKKLMSFAFDQMGDQVVAACGPGVTPQDKEEFRAALSAFSDKAKNRGATPEQVMGFQTRVRAALADNKVTPDELRALTAFLKDPPR
jgi:hypothetical protein